MAVKSKKNKRNQRNQNTLVSREILKYDIISENNKHNVKATDYIQTVIEKINYDTVFALNIDERNPFSQDMHSQDITIMQNL